MTFRARRTRRSGRSLGKGHQGNVNCDALRSRSGRGGGGDSCVCKRARQRRELASSFTRAFPRVTVSPSPWPAPLSPNARGSASAAGAAGRGLAKGTGLALGSPLGARCGPAGRGRPREPSGAGCGLGFTSGEEGPAGQVSSRTRRGRPDDWPGAPPPRPRRRNSHPPPNTAATRNLPRQQVARLAPPLPAKAPPPDLCLRSLQSLARPGSGGAQRSVRL